MHNKTYLSWHNVFCGAAVLLGVVVFGGGCRSVPRNSLAAHSSTKWEADIQAFEAADRTNPPPAGCIVFTGSSFIRMWTTLGSDFPGYGAVNRGFGGCQLADVHNYAERIIIKYHPRQVVMYAGGNDINARKDPITVFGDFKALVKKLKAELPDTQVVFISVPPSPARWSQTAAIRQVNRLIEEYCRRHGMKFVDTFSLMLGPDGRPRPEIYGSDRLHMNERGYAIWREAVAPVLLKR